ncbi:MAG: hypothetical protein WAK71_17475 [Streptosporangiaceae bacterium]
MSPFRTPSPVRSATFHRAVTGPAVAIVTAIAGTVVAWTAGVATAEPAAMVLPGLVRLAHPARPGLTRTGITRTGISARSLPQHAQLDAFTVTASSSGGSRSESDAGTAGRAGTYSAPQRAAIRMLASFGWPEHQFHWLNPLWARESGWKVRALNRGSGAYGIPQAVPGSKMASAGANWKTSAKTQIRWGLEYIRERYGSPHGAWKHELADGWY